MLDFLKIVVSQKGETITIWPEFLIQESKDLMIRGKKFYAIWNEEEGLWSTNEHTARELIDKETARVYQETKERFPDESIKALYLLNSSSKRWREWLSYISSLPDSFHPLDEKVTFSNTKVKKEDYVSRRLPYPLLKSPCPNYEKIISTLYDPLEREKLEWAIGSVIAGDSGHIQKFIVLYGDRGTGKSTILNVYQAVLEGYWKAFKSANLGNPNVSFALEAFKDNPLVAIEHDGNLSKIEDNTRLNSLVSHEPIEIDVKYENLFQLRINAFLFIGTNSPVRITDSKAGILRRLIDVNPSGRKIPIEEYDEVTEKVKFELGGIAYHCLSVYKELGKNYYENYSPTSMMAITNEFFNFVEDSYLFFKEKSEEGVSLNVCWNRYKEYVVEAKVPYPFSKRVFKEELKSYFRNFMERPGNNGLYLGFKEERFDYSWDGDKEKLVKDKDKHKGWLVWDGEGISEFDKAFPDIPAQYCWVNEEGKELPKSSWDSVKTTLKDIDPKIVHYCMPPSYVIEMDFDEKDENGNKNLELNMKAANAFPPTYAEVSKGGQGIHLCYIYDGDPSDLDDICYEHVEIKKHIKRTPIRRRLSKYNSIPIAHISSGLPFKKGGKTVIDSKQYNGEQKLINQIKQCLRKEPHADTTSNINFIKHLTDEAYDSGLTYDIRNIKSLVQDFAAGATNNKIGCSKVVAQMHFCSKDIEEAEKAGADASYEAYQTMCTDFYEPSRSEEELSAWNEAPIAIFDVESFINLFVLCYKVYDAPDATKKHEVIRWINPTPDQIDHLVKNYRLAGFNNLGYDNYMLMGRMQGYSNEQLYNLSQRIIKSSSKDKRSIGMFGSKKLSYTDIFDFSKEKKSLKKFEIDLDIHHQELGFKWDEPVPEEMWEKVAEYCSNDVLATEAVWNSPALQEDWLARQMLSVMSGLTVNDTNNTHSGVIIFGENRHPQSEFVYPDLSKEFPGYIFSKEGVDRELYIKDSDGKPIFTSGKSVYLGEDPSEGGYAWGKPGMYGNVKAFDVTSMHPSTMIRLNLFGDRYTLKLKEIVDLRKSLKKGDIELAKTMFDGKLVPYLTDKSKMLGAANALKIVINSIYGLTSAPFPNLFKDERNVDNVVAKRGALFMIQLKHKVQDMGYEVVHCKTDCIKVADADDKITAFIEEEGRKYGYSFEVEHWFDKLCIVNKAAYIGRLRDAEGNLGKWVAVADEFKETFTFKTLFSHEPIVFKDLCQSKQVQSAIFLDMNESLPPMDPALLKEFNKLDKKKAAYSILGSKSGPEYEKYLKLYKTDFSEADNQRLLYLSEIEASTHNYVFIGRFGSFCPVIDGIGGGLLMRDNHGKMASVEGAKGYRWLEAETIRGTFAEKQIALDYFYKKAAEAKDDISQFGDFDWFVSDTPYKGTIPIPLTADMAIKAQEKDILMGLMNPPEDAA